MNQHFPIGSIIPEVVNVIDFFLDKYSFTNYENSELSKTINFEYSDIAISCPAIISPRFDENNRTYYEISIQANFCQFLWNLCYTTIIIADEFVISPHLNSSYKPNIEKVDQAYLMFDKALSLFPYTNDKIPHFSEFFNFPKPEDENVCPEVKTSNIFFLGSLAFIIFHELGHYYLNHVKSDEEIISHELDADFYAVYEMCISQNEEINKHTSISAIIAIQSLIFSDNTLQGGKYHPDSPERLQNLLNKIKTNINPKDFEYCIVIAIVIYKLWSIAFDKVNLLNNIASGSNYSHYFNNIQEELTKYKNEIPRPTQQS